MTPLLACDVASDDPVNDGAGVRDDVETIDVFANAPVAVAMPSAGWIELDSSPIVPWCGAVLVAPDVIVTTASCVVGWDKGFLRAGFGEQVEVAPRVAVEEVLVQKDADVPEHALAALRLAEPVRGIDPVELAMAPLHRRICGVQSVAYQYVLDGDPSTRWSWQGCIDTDAWLAAQTGAPNCHGDIGAGAFVPSGALLGVVVDARTDGLCSREERIATVADNEAFFDAALDLSRP